MTELDLGIVLFAVAMGAWGYRHGLVVGALTVIGFAAGAVLGSRIGQALLEGGATSPYAPGTAVVGGLLVGAIVATSLEGQGRRVRTRFVRPGRSAAVDGVGGALLFAALALALVWMLGAMALNAPRAREARQAVQRSLILGAINDLFPPSDFLLRALNRVDPGVAVTGPSPDVGRPDPGVVTDPDVIAAGASVVRVTGTACGLGVAGSGWVVAPGLVVTNAHVIAGEDDTAVSPPGSDSRIDAVPVLYDSTNDLALLRVSDLDAPPLTLATDPARGTRGAILGYPANGPFDSEAARLGSTGTVLSEDSYGNGRFQRRLTALRGLIRSGNSGGPVVGLDGRVLTTVFAATTKGRPGGYGVPNEIVGRKLGGAGGEVGTGHCA